ncbi:MAG: sigma-70 family RNA polymerase sigma factor [Nannocystaceae bacterium]|nr:sigma-70 family RNA polymerase sigma factor [Nannocystaceae bacterium]
MTDADLLEAWVSGDLGAGGQLFERNFESVVRFFRNKVDGPIDDLVQKTFLGCLEGRQRVRGEAGFRAYLFGVARNVLGKYWRSRVSGLREVDLETESVVQLGASPTSIFARDRGQLAMLNALRRIPLDSQIVLELCYWELMTAAEIAVVLEIPLGTAKTRIRRARALLSTQIEALGTGILPMRSTVTRLATWARAVRPSGPR